MSKTLGMTAEMCRQNALQAANALQETETPEDGSAMAAVGMFWTQLGILTHMLGDPDYGKGRGF